MSTYTYTLNTTFNGTSPTSTPPWMTTTFTDGTSGDVILTLQGSLNVPSEFFSNVAFNVASNISPRDLEITQLGGPPAPISYRDLELMLLDRGIEVDHTTIFR